MWNLNRLSASVRLATCQANERRIMQVGLDAPEVLPFGNQAYHPTKWWIFQQATVPEDTSAAKILASCQERNIFLRPQMDVLKLE